MDQLREQLDSLNLQLLNLINERGRIVQKIGEVKGKQSQHRYDPVREREMLNTLIENNHRPVKR